MPVRKILTLCLLVTLCLAAPRAWAQAALASLRGTVTDPDNAVIPGATVTATPRAGAAAAVVTTQQDGSFVLTGLQPGLYSVTITRSGFATYVQQTVRLAAGQQIMLNPHMSIEEQSQQIQVNANPNQVSVDPDNNASATVIKDKDLDALSDDPDELSSELTALAGPSVGPSGGQIYVDGFTGGQLPPKSSIREIRVNQNPFSAEYDKMGFGRVEVFTKPGTDKLHAFYSIQGGEKALNTSNPFLGASNQQPSYYTLFMIGSVTGPLGKYASFSLGGSHRTIQDNTIVNPTAFYSTSPTSTTPCLPGPGNSTGCSIQSGYPVTARAVFHPQTRSDISPRFDLQLGQNNTLTARYQYYVNGQQNAGIGNTNLPSVGFSTEVTQNTIQLSDTQIFGSKIINETRFEYQRDTSNRNPNSTAPTLSVQGIFTAGGSPQGTASSTSAHIEIQNYTSIQLKKNFIRTGGRLRTTAETLTSNAGSNGTLSYASLNDYIAGNVNLYRQTVVNQATVHARLTDIGLYYEDDWKIRPNLTFTYGLRYEAQTVINSAHDFVPRLQVSYGIPRHSGDPITVLHAGFGLFYDRFDLADVLTTQQLNGSNQIQIVAQNPVNCSPSEVSLCGAGGNSLIPTTYTLGGNIRSAYTEIGVVGVDQQIGKIGSFSFNYATNKGIHQYLSRAFRVTDPAGKLTGYSDQFQSNGYSMQQQFFFNGRVRAKHLTLFGFYGLTLANSNTNGADTFATNPYNSHVDYGRASYEQRNFVVAGGSWQLPKNVALSPFILAQSGTYYDITSGIDTNQDGQINDRPFYVNSGAHSCFNAADYSLVNTGNLTPVPVDSCVGPANFTFNLRANKTFGFGRRTEQTGGPGGSHGGSRGGRGGGPGGGPGGRLGFGSSTGRRYNFTIGAQAANLFNAVPYGTPNSVVSSGAQFGRFTTLAGGPFSSSTAVRRITLQANFSF